MKICPTIVPVTAVCDGYLIEVDYKTNALGVLCGALPWLLLGLLSLSLVGCQKPANVNQAGSQNENSTTLATMTPATTQSCPKLLRRSLNSNVIVYRNTTVGDCDYYFYPNVGEKLSVSTSDPFLSVQLVAPILHEFNQGALTVTQSGRYIIRVSNMISDDGVLPPSVDYTLKLSVN